MPIPDDNRINAQKVDLGRKLFFDRLLSRDRSLACSSCHDPKRAFTDGRDVAIGVFDREGTRNVPTLINRGYGASHFWDGRSKTLEEQVLRPIQDPNELDMTIEELVERLKVDMEYSVLFQIAFAREVCSEDIAKALASYVRTVLSGNSPVDRYYLGQPDALTPTEREGLEVFRGKGNCTLCHIGPNFTDERFHNTGVAWRNGKLLDPGRFAVTGNEEDRGRFKTPTLRDVARTAPYMHDGSLKTLKDVIEFYDRGGIRNTYLDPVMKPRRFTRSEKEALLAFLRALSGEIQEGNTCSNKRDVLCAAVSAIENSLVVKDQ